MATVIVLQNMVQCEHCLQRVPVDFSQPFSLLTVWAEVSHFSFFLVKNNIFLITFVK